MFGLSIEIPDTFLNAEIRSGYFVKEEAKQLWAIQLDLLQQFINVCNKYELSWYALGGTLLGAIRHKGYIPWDDDIDIIMPRKDYDILLEVGPEAFQHPYFFQCTLTENKFWRTHVQIRNSLTTGCILADASKNINRGIFIDIMVLDEVPESYSKRNRHRMQIQLHRWLRYVDRLRINQFAVVRFAGNVIAGTLGNSYYCYCFRKMNQICAQYQGSGTRKVAHTTLSYREVLVWDKRCFSETIQKEFEFLKINVPSGYHEILCRQYGDDYMKIPVTHPSSAHGSLIVNASLPFAEFFKRS